jgi:deazaflavin-dependent oxidoreductase (nitroreductase family)
MGWRGLLNLPVRAVLHSPAHGLLSRSVLTLTYTGRRSGRRYTVPVNYARDDRAIYVFSPRERRWWRNLRGGAAVTVRLRGRDLRGDAEVCAGTAAATPGLLAILRRNPAFRRFARVTLDADGRPSDPTALDRLAARGVIVRVTDLAPSGARPADRSPARPD